MKLFLIAIIFFLSTGIHGAYAQKKTDTLEFDLYFRYFDFFRYFDGEKKHLNKLERQVRKLDLSKLEEDDRLYFVLFRQAMKDSLIRHPYIYVRNDSMDFNLFVSPADYERFVNYTYDKLEQEHKKVRIRAEVKETSYFQEKAYICKKLITIEKTDGETFNNKGHQYPNRYCPEETQ